MAVINRSPFSMRRMNRNAPRTEVRREGRSFSDFADLFGMGAPVTSGQVVTPETAMRFSAVFACVRLLEIGRAHV